MRPFWLIMTFTTPTVVVVGRPLIRAFSIPLRRHSSSRGIISSRTTMSPTSKTPSNSKFVRHASTDGTSTEPSSSCDGGDNDKVTILGFGSLLSERSARTTFPELSNFRLGRIPNYRRVFRHPAPIFFQRGIADMETLQISSLCAEPINGHKPFVCSVFEVSNDDLMEDGVPSKAFLEREQEFDFATVRFAELDGSGNESTGILCTSSSDKTFLDRWGKEHFEREFGVWGIETIWNWKEDSGLRPCAAYLRHCVLAAEKMGPECYESFLDDTYLVDRSTTIREYLKQYPEIMTTLPPPELAVRYGG